MLLGLKLRKCKGSNRPEYFTRGTTSRHIVPSCNKARIRVVDFKNITIECPVKFFSAVHFGQQVSLLIHPTKAEGQRTPSST